MSITRKIYRVLNALVRRSRWFNEEIFPGCNKLLKYNTFNTKVINLGSTSSCYAFDYSGLPVKGANFALPHNPLMGDEAILKNYFGYLDPNESHVIISLCVFSSLAGSYDIDDDRYYLLLYPSSIPHFSYRRQQRVKQFAYKPFRYFPMFAFFGEFRRFSPKKDARPMTEDEMQMDAEKWIKGWMQEFSLKSFSAPLSLLNKDAVEDAVSILNRMISFCTERNITPTLVLPPMYHTLADKFDKDARNNLIYNMIDKLDDKSVSFLNYMDDKMFSYDRTLFKDSFLLNSKGRKLFTQLVLKDIGINN